MKTSIRNHAAAAMLLLPLAAAMLVATPAQAQQYRVAVAQPAVATPKIERFVMNARGRIEPGRELRFRLVGTPAADAWLDIPGVARHIDLKESRPGVYEAEYTVRRRDDLRAFPRAVATLRNGKLQSIARVDVRGDDVGQPRDTQAPRISDVTPADGVRIGDRGRVHLFARLGDEGGSGVDPATVRLRIDGRDVTGAAQVSAEEVRFRNDLPDGVHTADLEVRDRAGNAARKTWSFQVVDTNGRHN